jgi:hypothetical protein
MKTNVLKTIINHQTKLLSVNGEMAVYILRAAYQIVGALDNSLRK